MDRSERTRRKTVKDSAHTLGKFWKWVDSRKASHRDGPRKTGEETESASFTCLHRQRECRLTSVLCLPTQTQISIRKPQMELLVHTSVRGLKESSKLNSAAGEKN